jgi:hypothetical protein
MKLSPRMNGFLAFLFLTAMLIAFGLLLIGG